MKKSIITIVLALLLINLTSCNEENSRDIPDVRVGLVPAYVTNVGIFYKGDDNNYYLYEMDPEDFEDNLYYYDADMHHLLCKKGDLKQKYVTTIDNKVIYYYIATDYIYYTNYEIIVS